jgi:hypothetical protein
MAVVEPIIAPSRRKILAAGAAAVALVTAPGAASTASAPPSDLVLLQLRAQFRAARAAHDQAAADMAESATPAPAAVAAEASAWQGYLAALAELEATPATGLLGLVAKASLVAELHDTCPGDAEAVVIYSLARDASAILGRIAPMSEPRTMVPDAELLAAGEAFDRAGAELLRIYAAQDGVTDDALMARLTEEEEAPFEARRDALDAITRLPARTHAGRQVKARALRIYLEERDDPVEQLAASLAADILGEGVAA